MDVLEIIIGAAMFQGLLLSLVFVFSKKHRSFVNRLLGMMLLAFVLQALSDLIPFDSILYYNINNYFTLPELKLLFPILILHIVLEKVGRTKVFKTFLKLHYGLAFFFLALTPISVLLFFIDTSLVGIFGQEGMEWIFMTHQYYAFFLTIAVLIISIKETFTYRNIVRNEISDISMLNINWLWQFIFGLVPVLLFWGAELFRIALGGTGQTVFTTLAFLCIAIFIYFVSVKVFLHRSLFEDSSNSPDLVLKEPARIGKIDLPINSNACKIIQEKMAKEQFYLDQELTIHLLSRKIKISSRNISICVNQSLGLNFNEWVNQYRVEYALKILADSQNDHYSIEGVGLDSGFKSRSAMYTAFKRKTGHTPGHFKA